MQKKQYKYLLQVFAAHPGLLYPAQGQPKYDLIPS